MFDVKVCLVDVNERYIPNFGTQQAIKEKIYTVRKKFKILGLVGQQWYNSHWDSTIKMTNLTNLIYSTLKICILLT